MPRPSHPSQATTDQAFLEDLKRREEALDNRAPRSDEGEIIDVEAIEIRPVGEES